MLVRSPLVERVIGLAIEVHREMGVGLLESIYQECMAHELAKTDLAFESEVGVPLTYKGDSLRGRLRMDFVVDRSLVLEIKSVDQLLPIHTAQVITYLRLSGLPQALLINFNRPTLRGSIRSFFGPSRSQMRTEFPFDAPTIGEESGQRWPPDFARSAKAGGDTSEP
jgi:GxxExxY protein